MNLKRYEAFYFTAQLGSVSKAAEQMGCTQSALSHLIQALEAELGFCVLTRSRSGVQTTAQGRLLLPAVRTLLEQGDRVNRLAEQIRSGRAGTIRIGTFTSVAVHWLPPLIQAFRSEHPFVELHLENGDYYDVDHWLKGGDVDIGFVTLPGPEGFRILPLKEDRLLAILPKNHPLASLPRFPVSSVEKESFISLLESSNHDARRALDSAGIVPNVTYTTKDDYAVIAMVAQGLGISIMPELLLRGQTDRVAVLELDPPAHRTLALAVRKTNGDAPYLDSFADFVCRWVGENG